MKHVAAPLAHFAIPVFKFFGLSLAGCLHGLANAPRLVDTFSGRACILLTVLGGTVVVVATSWRA